jgi:histidine racemase
MESKKFLIANGNSTIICWGMDRVEADSFIADKLKEVEQVGFASERGGLPYFEMMGGELSINGTLAFASTLNLEGQLFTSGISQIVEYVNADDYTSITVPLRYALKGNMVMFEGIGFIYLDAVPSNLSVYLRKLCVDNRLPAFGAWVFEKGVRVPYVFVLGTQSCVKESACGSGSIALSLLSGEVAIKQPTGDYIYVFKNGDSFTIKAKVVQIQ